MNFSNCHIITEKLSFPTVYEPRGKNKQESFQILQPSWNPSGHYNSMWSLVFPEQKLLSLVSKQLKNCLLTARPYAVWSDFAEGSNCSCFRLKIRCSVYLFLWRQVWNKQLYLSQQHWLRQNKRSSPESTIMKSEFISLREALYWVQMPAKVSKKEKKSSPCWKESLGPCPFYWLGTDGTVMFTYHTQKSLMK